MTTAVDVAKYIKSKRHLYGEVQLQKLAYYAQAWALTWTGKPLFEDRVEAWKMGPVVPNLRFRFDVTPDPSALSERDAALVDAVLNHYGSFNGGQLAAMSHDEAPWKSTWDGSPRCSAEIPHDSMRSYYTEQVLNGGGPTAPALTGDPVSDEEMAQVAAANAERWKDALDLLSR